jgi:hypothetical protein
MATLMVVKTHDIIEDFNPGLAIGSKYDIGGFTLQGGSETLHRGIVPTINDTAHADSHMGGCQSFPAVHARILLPRSDEWSKLRCRRGRVSAMVQCGFDQFRAQIGHTDELQ